MNYKNAYEELKRLYEKLEQEKYKLILDSNGLINANGILQQENAQLKDKIETTKQFYINELLKRENLKTPIKMSWESIEMFNILDGNK